jgi:hypothetical protein
VTFFGLARIMKREGDIWEYQRVYLEFLPNQFDGLVWRRVRLTANWELFNCYHMCVLAGADTHVEKRITDRYDGSGGFSSPTDRWSHVKRLSSLEGRVSGTIGDPGGENTLTMTDQLSRDLAVRDEISKQERSAMDAKAVGETSTHATGIIL